MSPYQGIYTFMERRRNILSIDTMPTPASRKGSKTKPATLAAILLVATAASLAASAEELRPIEAKSLQLGEMNGVAYYTEQSHGYRVVTTLAGQDGTPVRFESILLPGQKAV